MMPMSMIGRSEKAFEFRTICLATSACRWTDKPLPASLVADTGRQATDLFTKPMSALREKIEAFCKSGGITVPIGFSRHSPSRYAVIRKTDGTWQLTAKTWFNVSDVINYLDNYCEGAEYKILDFEKELELKRRGKKQLEKLGTLQDVV